MDWRLLRRLFGITDSEEKTSSEIGGTWSTGLALAVRGEEIHFGHEFVLFVQVRVHYLDEGMRRAHLAME